METVTIKDIAKICGVGVSTVSRALNNHPDINLDTKQKIMAVVEEYNFIPNNSARNLKITDSKSIAILVKGISNPLFTKMIKIMEQKIQEADYSLVLRHVDENQDEIDVALELIKEKRLNGIVFLGGIFTHTKEKLELLTVPYVLSTVGIPKGISNCSSVSVSDEEESYKMVDYLIHKGHKKIALITAPTLDESIGKLRTRGYIKALKDNGIKPSDDLVFTMVDDYDYYTMDNGYEVGKKIAESGVDCTAIFAISDTLAIGACKALIEMGKKVPEDISVAGFDGIDMAKFYSPEITTLRQPVVEMAKETIRILFDNIKNDVSGQVRLFETTLIEGGSVKEI